MSSSPPSSFYQRYINYPEYCSTPDQMQRRHIPPISLKGQDGDDFDVNDDRNRLQLVHATVVIRHGARTPWSGPSNLRCWKDFWTQPETGVWDCHDDITTIMTQPLRSSSSSASVDDPSTSSSSSSSPPPPPSFAFRKLYDALNFPLNGLTNELNGTCQLGQLLLQGYHQQLHNGRILREAYGYNGPPSNSYIRYPSSMNLIDLNVREEASSSSRPWDSKYLRWRSDDDQRTVMSGQVLLQGLFGPELESTVDSDNRKDYVTVHLADRDKDVLDANTGDCPRLAEIKQRALLSDEYQSFNTSKETYEVRQFLREQLGVNVTIYNPIDDDGDILDCLMCTICTDRPLHPSIDDYDGVDESIVTTAGGDGAGTTEGDSELSWFTRVAHHDIQQYTIPMLWNDSQYAKVSLGPLWYEIMLNINPYVSSSLASASLESASSPPPAPRLALFSGHDTTIMPLLASLGPKVWNETDWATYASMMIIEIYHIKIDDGNTSPSLSTLFPSKVAFRLLYNGRVLTQFVDGCGVQRRDQHQNQDGENVAISDLCDISHFKSRIDPIATRESSFCINTESSRSSAIDLSTSEGVMIYIGSVVTSFLLGLLIPCCLGRRRRHLGSTIRRKEGYQPTTHQKDTDCSDSDVELDEFQDEPGDHDL